MIMGSGVHDTSSDISRSIGNTPKGNLYLSTVQISLKTMFFEEKVGKVWFIFSQRGTEDGWKKQNCCISKQIDTILTTYCKNNCYFTLGSNLL